MKRDVMTLFGGNNAMGYKPKKRKENMKKNDFELCVYIYMHHTQKKNTHTHGRDINKTEVF